MEFVKAMKIEDFLNRMTDNFVYSDGSVETCKEDLLEMDTFLQEITAKAGEIYNVNQTTKC